MTSLEVEVEVEGEAAVRVAVENLTVRLARSQLEVVRDVSLSVRAGEILGVVGESGSGKTTLGLAMIGHARRGLEISAGRVVLDGTAVAEMAPEALARLRGSEMAYVPQDPGTALNPARRIGPQMIEALTAHGRSGEEARQRTQEVLREVGLEAIPNLLNVYPHQLSGGQQQRVVVAMAFACRPGLIVMDEPTTGLDVTTQRTVLETVKELCGKYGVAAVYVSHDVAVVAELADRVAVVYAGQVVELGRSADVLANPRHPYTRALLRAVPSATRRTRLVPLEGVRPQPGQFGSGCAFAPRCSVSVDRCDHEQPTLVPVDTPGQAARCLLVNEVDRREAAVVEMSPLDELDREGELDSSAPVLEVRDLRARYGTRQVLHGIDLTIGPNECVAVVGESGSGKTTLSRCLVGLHRSWTGEIALEGAQQPPGIKRRSSESLRDMQYVFQNPYASLNPRRTIGGSLMQPLLQFTKLDRAAREARVRDALDSVALPGHLLNAYPDQLSGGERQRVAIARALAAEPRLLVCDEVTSALDVSVQASVVEMLRRLQDEQSLSLLFVTHNLPLVRSIAQRVIVMQDGRVVEAGDVDDVLDNPQDEYTQRLLDHLPKYEGLEVGRVGANGSEEASL